MSRLLALVPAARLLVEPPDLGAVRTLGAMTPQVNLHHLP
jgi:hypothetical protein